MEEVETLVRRVADPTARQEQRHLAFGELVRRFQDMVYGCALGYLGDFHLAQDAAQETFLVAYQELDRLKDPRAFPGWLSRIVRSRCNRLRRGDHLPTQPVEEVRYLAAPGDHPDILAERGEMQQQVHQALGELPEALRLATTLYYITGYSYQEIAALLEVPTATCRKRVQLARERLKKRMLEMAEENFAENRPSKDAAFAARVMDLIRAVDQGDAKQVERLLEKDPSLVSTESTVPGWWEGEYQPLHLAAAKGHMEVVEELLRKGADVNAVRRYGLTPLSYAVEGGHSKVVDLLIKHGAKVDIVLAAQMGDLERVRQMLSKDPALVHYKGPHGATALHQVHNAEIARLLIDHGADLNVRDDGHQSPPIVWVLGSKPEVRDLLLERGAQIPDIYVGTFLGDLEKVKTFLAADPSSAAAIADYPYLLGGFTALHIASFQGHIDIARCLIDAGANIHERRKVDPYTDPATAFTALEWAERAGKKDVVALLKKHGA